MTDDERRDAEINALHAKVGALEQLVWADLAERWDEARLTRWYDLMSATNDDAPSPYEHGRADWTNAIDRLAVQLRARIRRRRSAT